MLSWIIRKLFKKKSKKCNGQQSKKNSQKIMPMNSPMAWSSEKPYQQEVLISLAIPESTSTPVTRVERVLNFADDYVNSITSPKKISSSPDSVETPHSGGSLDGDNSQIWDVSVAICDGAEDSDDDIQEVEEKHTEVQSSSHLAAIRADALGMNGLSNSFRKPSLPPLSLSTQSSSNQESEEEQNNGLNSRARDEEPSPDQKTKNDHHSDDKGTTATEALPNEKTAIQLFNELGERPEDSDSDNEDSDSDEEIVEKPSVTTNREEKVSTLPPLLPSLSANSSSIDNSVQLMKQHQLKPLSSSMNSSLNGSLNGSIHSSIERPTSMIETTLNNSFNKISFKRFDSFESFGKKGTKHAINNNNEVSTSNTAIEDDGDSDVEETLINMISSPLPRKNKSRSRSRSKSRTRSKSKSRNNIVIKKSVKQTNEEEGSRRHCGASPMNDWQIEVEDFSEDFDTDFVPEMRNTRRAIQL